MIPSTDRPPTCFGLGIRLFAVTLSFIVAIFVAYVGVTFWAPTGAGRRASFAMIVFQVNCSLAIGLAIGLGLRCFQFAMGRTKETPHKSFFGLTGAVEFCSVFASLIAILTAWRYAWPLVVIIGSMFLFTFLIGLWVSDFVVKLNDL